MTPDGDRLGSEAGQEARARELYLELLKKALSRSLFRQIVQPVSPSPGTFKARLSGPFRRLLARRGLVIARVMKLGPATFAQSPPPMIRDAETMIGPIGLDNLQRLVEDVLEHDVPGDLIETGVWRGGATILMRGILEARGDPARTVWAADSFQGLPTARTTGHPQDVGADHWARQDWMVASLGEVRANFERYGLLDDRVRFLPGWFHETLPTAPIDKLALMRLDGDMYGSTMDALRALYPRLSVGGYVIVDDYWLPGCRAAVDDYRREQGIDDAIVPVDRAIVYWQRSS